VKLRLPPDADRGGDRIGEVRLRRQLGVDTGGPGGVRLALDLRGRACALGVDDVVGALEVAGEGVLLDDSCDELDRLLVRAGIPARAVDAERVDQPAVDKIVADGELGRRVARRP
jgi:hypothetical protein